MGVTTIIINAANNAFSNPYELTDVYHTFLTLSEISLNSKFLDNVQEILDINSIIFTKCSESVSLQQQLQNNEKLYERKKRRTLLFNTYSKYRKMNHITEKIENLIDKYDEQVTILNDIRERIRSGNGNRSELLGRYSIEKANTDKIKKKIQKYEKLRYKTDPIVRAMKQERIHMKEIRNMNKRISKNNIEATHLNNQIGQKLIENVNIQSNLMNCTAVKNLMQSQVAVLSALTNTLN